MPRGGRRVGAGRKPGSIPRIARPLERKVVTLGGQDWKALPPVDVEVSSPLVTPPTGMREPEAEVWKALAPHAVLQQTLVASTVRGFRELCEQAVLKQQIADAIAAAGAATSGMDVLLRHYARLAQRLDQSLARYRLTAQGKPEPTAQSKPKAANPWAV